MADRTISVLIDHTASLNSAYLANQGEEITLDVTIPAGLVSLALDGYIDFELPDGTAYFKGPFSCSTGTISTTLGATDSILDASGKVHWQFVLAITTGSVRDVKWKSKQYDTEVLASIGATNAAILPYVPQMVFPVAYPAANVSVADVAGHFTGTSVETALAEIDQNINFASPVGEIKIWPAATAPTKYLICDGSLINRTTYSALFAVIGSIYGAGDGSTTFALPNYKGRVPVGLDAAQSEFNTLGKTCGAKTHVLSIDEMPSHTHEKASCYAGTVDPTFSDPRIWGKYGAIGTEASLQTGATGGGLAHNNIQPSVAVNYIIRALV